MQSFGLLVAFERGQELRNCGREPDRLQRQHPRPPRGDGPIFEEFDDLDGGQQSPPFDTRARISCASCGSLKQRLYAAAPIQPALAGADQEGAHAKRGLGFDAFVSGRDPIDPRRSEGQKAAP